MIDLDFLEAQLSAQPFIPFVLVLNSGDRYNVRTPDHADLPPVDEQTGERNGYMVIYNDRSIPRYLAIENVTALEHSLAS